MADTKNNLNCLIANVVDVQQSIMMQFDHVTKTLDDLKLNQQNSISSLREDLRRTDDRALKQIEELKKSHSDEVNNLIGIIKHLVARDSAPPAQAMHAVPGIHPTAAPVYNPQFQMAMNQRQMEEYRVLQLQAQAQAHAQLQQSLFNTVSNITSGVGTPTQQKPVVSQPVTQAAQITPKPPPVVALKNESTPVVVAPVVKPSAPILEKPKEEKLQPVGLPQPTTTSTAPAKPAFGNWSNIFDSKPTNVSPSKPAIVKDEKDVNKDDDDDDDETVEEYEPSTDFKPVIPLPELVEVKTGEEGEESLFANRAKLYVYDNNSKEWKERGTGELKILHNQETKTYRVVMRRDQVHKVCANFRIVGTMTITKMANNEKAYTWVCEDFSENEPQMLRLSARFGNIEIALQFKHLFELAASKHRATPKKGEKTIDNEIKSADKVEVKKDKEVTISPSNKENNGFGDKFKPAPGSWECKDCYVRNDAESEVCTCCGSGKDGKTTDKAASIFSKPSILKPATGTPKFTFGMSAAVAAKEPLGNAQATNSPVFGASLNGNTSTTTSNSLFGGSGSTPKSNIFGGGASANTSNAVSPPAFSFGKSTTTTPKFSFLKASEQSSASPTTSAETPPVQISFNKNTNQAAKPTFSFSKQTTLANGNEKEEAPKSVFGSFTGGETFATLAAKSKNTNIFEGEMAKKAQEEFAAQKKSSSLVKKEDDGEESDNTEEYEPQVEFKPVVPLPELIEVKTGEEDEDVVFKARCKLYRYLRDIKENKERGVGDVKILHNKATGKYRVVMRREQVHKLCANFRIEPSLEFKLKDGYPNILTFVCTDFSEDTTNGIGQVFTFKFKDAKIADDFCAAINAAQN